MASEKRKVVRRVKATVDGQPETKSRPGDSAVATPVEDQPELAKREAKVKKVKTDADVPTKRRTNRANKGKGTKLFILFRPFVALGCYVRDSWRELRKVEWPSRRAAWKMTAAVIVFCVGVCLFVLLFDWVSQWIIQEVVL